MVLTACTPGISDIYQQVIDDSVAQYEIVKRQGAAMDRCVHAGIDQFRKITHRQIF